MGIKQGDNIVPVLFLFLMQGMVKCLETKHMRDTKKEPVLVQTPPKSNEWQNQLSIKPDWHQRERFLLHSHSLC
jgi:hypothetical protein